MSTHAPVVLGSPHTLDTIPDLGPWVAGFDHTHIDVGTGDGRYAVHVARRCPCTAVIGLDTSLDHLRGAKRRHPANLRFVRLDACGHLDGGLPPAGDVTVNFPYGSLLRGLVEGEPKLLSRLGSVLAADGRIEVRVNRTAFVATGLDPDHGPAAIQRNLRRIDGLGVQMRELGREELRSFPSTWSKRLGFGREAGAVLIVGTRRLRP